MQYFDARCISDLGDQNTFVFVSCTTHISLLVIFLHYIYINGLSNWCKWFIEVHIFNVIVFFYSIMALIHDCKVCCKLPLHKKLFKKFSIFLTVLVILTSSLPALQFSWHKKCLSTRAEMIL